MHITYRLTNKIRLHYTWQLLLPNHFVGQAFQVNCVKSLSPWLKGHYCHNQQGMEFECYFKINSVTENNTPHDKVILPLMYLTLIVNQYSTPCKAHAHTMQNLVLCLCIDRNIYQKCKLPSERYCHVKRSMIIHSFPSCKTCGDYIYQGKKFNAKTENVQDERYLGLRIFRFYIKCPKCISEISFKVSPTTEHSLINLKGRYNISSVDKNCFYAFFLWITQDIH